MSVHVRLGEIIYKEVVIILIFVIFVFVLAVLSKHRVMLVVVVVSMGSGVGHNHLLVWVAKPAHFIPPHRTGVTVGVRCLTWIDMMIKGIAVGTGFREAVWPSIVPAVIGRIRPKRPLLALLDCVRGGSWGFALFMLLVVVLDRHGTMVRPVFGRVVVLLHSFDHRFNAENL